MLPTKCGIITQALNRLPPDLHEGRTGAAAPHCHRSSHLHRMLQAAQPAVMVCMVPVAMFVVVFNLKGEEE